MTTRSSKGFGISLAATVYGPSEFCDKHRRRIWDKYLGCHECLTDYMTRRMLTPTPLVMSQSNYLALKKTLE